MRFVKGWKLALVLVLAMGSLLLADKINSQTSDSADQQTQCTTANGKWCLNSDGASGYCSYGTATCPAYNTTDCSTQGGEWCSSSGGGMGWCSPTPGNCPINDQAACEAKSRNWCVSQSGGGGWCTYSSTEKCPAYTEIDCKAQNRTWCVSPGSASTSGWCTDSCPYSSAVDQKTQCTNANGKWCLNSDGVSGYCSYGTSSCPAYNSADCSAQGGDWCAYTSGSGGYCNSTPNSCPINDKTSCEAKSRNWCTSQYGGSGWCAMSNESCPSSSSTATPAANYSTWPTTQVDCELYSGLWCKSTGSYYSTYTGSCMMANNTCPTTPRAGYMTCWDNTEVLNTSACPTTPTNETDCTKMNKYWCKNSYTSSYGGSTSSGWCQGNTCSLNPSAGQMTCPDGKTFASNMSGCPKKSASSIITPIQTPTTPIPVATSTPTITPIPVPVQFSWPNTQSDCEHYNGNWCKNESGSYNSGQSGWCNMGIQNCPVAAKPGYMTCWNNTQVRTGASCPATPSIAADCKKGGYNWCTSTTGVSGASASGWCSVNVCGMTPPAGQMICPDGLTASASLDVCPQKITVRVLCPDGVTNVVVGGACPLTYTCTNGATVNSASQCPKTEDDISVCLGRGGVWCKDPSGVKSGYCAAQATECKTTLPTTEIKPLPVQLEGSVSISEVKRDQRDLLRELRNMERFFKPLKLDSLLARIVATREKVNKLEVMARNAYDKEKQAINEEINSLRLEVEKQNLLQEIKNMERLFKSLKDETALAKISALREEINKLTSSSGAIYKENTEAIYDEMEDLREAMRDAQENGSVMEPERDKKFQEKALRDLKKSVKSFEKFLLAFESKVKKVEKQGITVNQTIKDLVIDAKDLIARAKVSKTYDEAKESMDRLPEISEDLNEVLPHLEQLARLPEALKMVNRRVADADRAIKTTVATAKRLKINADDEIQKMKSLVTEAKEAIVKLKTGSMEDAENFFDFIQESIMEKLNEAFTSSQMIQTVANVKKYVNNAAADLKRFDRRIVQLEKKGEDMSEARALLDEAKIHLKDLRTASAQKLTVDIADEIIEHLNSLFSLDDQLEDILKLTSPDELERQLRRLFEGAPTEQLKPLEVSVLEKSLVKAYQTANFFRLTPARSLAIILE